MSPDVSFLGLLTSSLASLRELDEAAEPDDTRRILALPFEGNEWRRVVERRSAFQFLLDLHADSSAGERLAELDLGSLDERLRFVGEREGLLAAGRIPDGMPASHWWWWAPREPPST